MDIYVRFFAFVLITLALMVWEFFAPRKTQTVSRIQRWPANFAMGFANILLLRLAFAGAALGTAQWATENQWGLFNHWHIPVILEVVFSLVILDLVIYAQHRLFHRVPWLWRLHRVHHADLELDVSSGVRFHPLESLLSMAIKMAVVLGFGVGVASVFWFELSLNLLAMFNHSNIYIPAPLERVLRWFLITPDLHRIHHSVQPDEQQHNFGFSVPWWDQIFGSFLAQGHMAPDKIVLGDGQLKQPRQTQSLQAMLIRIPMLYPERFKS